MYDKVKYKVRGFFKSLEGKYALSSNDVDKFFLDNKIIVKDKNGQTIKNEDINDKDMQQCLFLGLSDGEFHGSRDASSPNGEGGVVGKIETMLPDQVTGIMDTLKKVKTLILPKTIERKYFEDDTAPIFKEMTDLEHIYYVEGGHSNDLKDLFLVRDKDGNCSVEESGTDQDIQITACPDELYKKIVAEAFPVYQEP